VRPAIREELAPEISLANAHAGSFYAVPVDAQQAIADLTEISSQIQAAVVFDEQAKVAASTLDDPARAEDLARAAADLLAQAERVKTGDGSLSQLEAATLEGSVFIVREGKVRIAATTASDPTVGLVFYDLKSALRQVHVTEPKKTPARKRSPKKTTATATKKPAAPRRKKTDAS
jgi:predicted regulator of Ras-like GTPase activity (Roadblock/LC7/MglB family)